MPNHIANRITGPSLGAIRDMLRGEEREIDFSRVIPMPEALGFEPHSGVIDAARLALRDIPEPGGEGIEGMIASLTRSNIARAKSPLEFSDKEWDDFIQCLQNKRQHGEYSWFDWCSKHWGTKWNAYAIKVTDEAIYFETAWACPVPIVRAVASELSRPLDEFVWEYADEDHGNNLGIWTYRGGKLELTKPPGSGQALEEWSMRLHGKTSEDIAEWRAEVEAGRIADTADTG